MRRRRSLRPSYHARAPAVSPASSPMPPSRRPPGSAGGLARLRAPALALLIAAGVALPSAQAQTQTPTKAKTTKAVKASKPGASAAQPASNLAKSELADIADLRKRMAAKTVVVTRHAEVADIAIQVWARTTLPKKYYVAVTQQGTVRRTLTATDEAEAWRTYDSFRRMAGLGDVGRPVLLGQMTVEPAPAARVPEVMAAAAMPMVPAVPTTPTIPAMAATPAPAVQTVFPTTQTAAPAPQAEAPASARELSATTGESVDQRTDARAGGYAVETLRRARFGDEVARLVWSAESSQYFVSLTRQGTVVEMLRSRDSAEATRTYEDYARQAEKRAALLQRPPTGPTSSASR